MVSSATPTVYVVDDDPQVCESLSLMVRSVGLEPKTYLSAEAFLDGCHEAPGAPKCLVLDVRMPGLSGLGLQQTLAAQGRRMPIIMISGCADIPMAVQAMSMGALDFLEKPFSRRAILARIQEGIDQDARNQRQCTRKAELTDRIEKLSARQREVVPSPIFTPCGSASLNWAKIGAAMAKPRRNTDIDQHLDIF